MQAKRAMVATAAGVAALLAGLGVTMAMAAGDGAPTDAGEQLVTVTSTSAPTSSSTVTSTTTSVVPTTTQAPAAPPAQQPPAGDNGQVNAPQQPADEPTVESTNPAGEVTAPPPPPVECHMDYSDPNFPQGIEVCEPA